MSSGFLEVDPAVRDSAAAIALADPQDPAGPADVHGPSRTRRPRIRVGLLVAVLVAFVLVSAFLPMPHSPTTPDAAAVLKAPSGEHWFGTDETGLDVFARTVRAGYIDLLVATGATVVAATVGTTLGLLASGWSRASKVFMRGVDIMQASPGLDHILSILAHVKGGPITILCVIALLHIPPFIRLVRTEAMVVRESGYVEFAEIIGVPRRAVMVRHVLRNVTGIILVQASVGIAGCVGVLAAISFLGFGVAPPTPPWGGMVQTGVGSVNSGAWWPVLFPAAFLTIAILTFTRIADDAALLLAKDQA